MRLNIETIIRFHVCLGFAGDHRVHGQEDLAACPRAFVETLDPIAAMGDESKLQCTDVLDACGLKAADTVAKKASRTSTTWRPGSG